MYSVMDGEEEYEVLDLFLLLMVIVVYTLHLMMDGEVGYEVLQSIL